MVPSPRARHRRQKSQDRLGNGQPVRDTASPSQRPRVRGNAKRGPVSQQVHHHLTSMRLGLLCLSHLTVSEKMHATVGLLSAVVSSQQTSQGPLRLRQGAQEAHRVELFSCRPGMTSVSKEASLCYASVAKQQGGSQHAAAAPMHKGVCIEAVPEKLLLLRMQGTSQCIG